MLGPSPNDELNLLTDPCDDHKAKMQHIMCDCTDPCTDVDDRGNAAVDLDLPSGDDLLGGI